MKQYTKEELNFIFYALMDYKHKLADCCRTDYEPYKKAYEIDYSQVQELVWKTANNLEKMK